LCFVDTSRGPVPGAAIAKAPIGAVQGAAVLVLRQDPATGAHRCQRLEVTHIDRRVGVHGPQLLCTFADPTVLPQHGDSGAPLVVGDEVVGVHTGLDKQYGNAEVASDMLALLQAAIAARDTTRRRDMNYQEKSTLYTKLAQELEAWHKAGADQTKLPVVMKLHAKLNAEGYHSIVLAGDRLAKVGPANDVRDAEDWLCTDVNAVLSDAATALGAKYVLNTKEAWQLARLMLESEFVALAPYDPNFVQLW
jgi:hypothetical protein